MPTPANIDRAKFTKDWNDGLTLSEIAERHNIGASTVSHYAKRWGLPKKVQGRRPTLESGSLTLKGGRWVTRGGVKRWVKNVNREDEELRRDPFIWGNEKAFDEEIKRTGEMLQVNRHRSCIPYEWFGPDPEPNPAGEECPCAGCEARFFVSKDLSNSPFAFGFNEMTTPKAVHVVEIIEEGANDADRN